MEQLPQLGVNISQSFIKEVLAYKQKKTCGLQLRAKYIDRVQFPSSEPAKLGVYFEYIATGSLPRNGEIPKPKRGKTGKLAAAYEKVEQQAKNFQRIMQRYDFTIEDVNVRIAIDGESAYVDLIVRANSSIKIDANTFIKAGQRVIIDLKSTGLLNGSKYDDYSWNLDGIEERDSIMLHALHYKYLCKKKYGENLPFLFMVFSTSNEIECKIIAVNVDEDDLNDYPTYMEKIKEEVRHELEFGFKAIPEYVRCSKCPLADTCEFKHDVPPINVVYYTIKRA